MNANYRCAMMPSLARMKTDPVGRYFLANFKFLIFSP